VNLAAFSNDYEDLQVDQARVPPIFTDTINAGSAEIEGIELEASAVLAEGLTLDMFASWLDGQYNSYIDNGVDLADQKHIQNAPDWHYGAGVDYAFSRCTSTIADRTSSTPARTRTRCPRATRSGTHDSSSQTSTPKVAALSA